MLTLPHITDNRSIRDINSTALTMSFRSSLQLFHYKGIIYKLKFTWSAPLFIHVLNLQIMWTNKSKVLFFSNRVIKLIIKPKGNKKYSAQMKRMHNENKFFQWYLIFGQHAGSNCHITNGNSLNKQNRKTCHHFLFCYKMLLTGLT